jgi:hypothetical protein
VWARRPPQPPLPSSQAARQYFFYFPLSLLVFIKFWTVSRGVWMDLRSVGLPLFFVFAKLFCLLSLAFFGSFLLELDELLGAPNDRAEYVRVTRTLWCAVVCGGGMPPLMFAMAMLCGRASCMRGLPGRQWSGSSQDILACFGFVKPSCTRC